MELTAMPPSDYIRLQELCAPFNIHIAVAAILAGETPAQIYVDKLLNPSVAVILPWDGHRVFLVGETDEELLLSAIRDVLFQFFSLQGGQAEKHEFVLYSASPSWEANFPLLCAGMVSIPAQRQYYVLTNTLPHWQTLLPAKRKLRQIDETVFAAQDLQNLPELIHEVHSESPSREDFLLHKFGYCLQEDSTLLGWCLSEYNHADRCEVGIETMAPYRRQGVAFLTASALLSHALAHGIASIGWHCWRNNTASSALARKLGGVLAAEYAVQVCRF